MALFPVSGSTVRGRVIASFPVNVEGDGGIEVVKVNGVWTISPRWEDLDLIDSDSEVTNKQVWAYDSDTGAYNRVRLPLVYAGAVRFDETQTLNNDQRLQARLNISAARSDYYNVMDYGATGDGTTDDAAAIQIAANLASTNKGILFFPVGEFAISAAISITGDGVVVRGCGSDASRIKTTVATINGIVFGTGSPQLNRVGVMDMGFTSSVSKSAGAAILLNNCYDCVLSDIFIADPFEGIRQIDSVLTISHNVRVSGITPTTGHGFYIDGGNDQSFYDCIATGSALNKPESGFHIVNSDAVQMDDCGTVYCGVGLKIVPESGQTVQHLFTSRCAFDSSGSHGCLVQPALGGTVNRWTSVNDWFATSTNNGIITAGAGTISGLVFVAPRIVNNQQYGGVFTVGDNIKIVGGLCAGNSGASVGTYDGLLYAADLSQFSIQDMRVGPVGGFSDTHGYNINIVAGASDNYQITNNDLRGGLTASLLDGGSGTNKVIQGNLPLSVNNTTGSGAVVLATSPTLTTPNIGTPSAGTLTNCTGLPVSTGISGLASGMATWLAAGPNQTAASLGADVNLSNTANYFDGPSVAVGAGTHLVTAHVTLLDTAGPATFFVKLWDGTTVVASGYVTTAGASNAAIISLQGLITGAGTVKLSVRDTSSTSGVIKANGTGEGDDSAISAVRIA